MHRTLFAAAASLSLVSVSAPLAAQDDNAAAEMNPAEEVGKLLGNMFGEADALSPEQEARMPMAEQVVGRIFPAGTYVKMMNETMKPMMDNMMSSIMGLPINEIAKLTGVMTPEMESMGEGSVEEIMAILDPAFEDRNRVIASVTLDLITDTMKQIEPSYRTGLARAYAVRFTTDELAELNTYFSTPTGSKYAAESMLIFADPQVMSAMNEMVPAMLNMMPSMMEKIAAANEQFPNPRTFSDLSAQEQARLSELLGVPESELSVSEPEDEFDTAPGSFEET